MDERVLLLSENYPPRTGGSSRWFYEIYERLPAARVLVVTSDSVKSEWRLPEGSTTELQRIRWGFSDWGVLSPSAAWRYSWLTFQVLAVARRRKVQAIHCGRNLPEGFIGALVGRILGVPVLCFVHGEELNTANKSRQLRKMTQWVFRACSSVVANSDNTLALLRDEWDVPGTKLERLYPGADCSRFRPHADVESLRAELGWLGRKVLLTVGRLQARKGHDHVLRVLPKLRERFPDVWYCIVGDGEEMTALKRLCAELAVEDLVEFVGEISDADLRRRYQACDLFVLANREVDGDFEGFGMVLVEAQASGRPVLAGRSGGTSETMLPGETGELVDATNLRALDAAISALLADPERMDLMGQRGALYAQETFDWDSLAARAEAILLRR